MTDSMKFELNFVIYEILDFGADKIRTHTHSNSKSNIDYEKNKQQFHSHTHTL